MNESLVENRKQKEKALGRWENEGGEVLPPASLNVEKAADANGSRKEAVCGDDDTAKSGGKVSDKVI